PIVTAKNGTQAPAKDGTTGPRKKTVSES
ncbi:unnamed protein product, partial [Allacma fusca]